MVRQFPEFTERVTRMLLRNISFNGGWHDAGDLSQQTVHTAEVTLSLFKLAKAMKNRDPQFAQRVRQEAEWG